MNLNKKIHRETNTQSKCRKLGIEFEASCHNETGTDFLAREKRNLSRIRYRLKKFKISLESIPEEPILTNDSQYNKAMDCIRSFELKEMTREIILCSVCKERRIDLKVNSKGVCKRCASDKQDIKMFSNENNMNPGKVPNELAALSMIEQQLISRISPCINVHLLKHGGLSASGHCVTFPQNIDEASAILPRLPEEINIIRVQKQGKHDSVKEFRVRRYVVQNALEWLKMHNPVYNDISISFERLSALPIDGELKNIQTIEFNQNTNHIDDKGPANDQTNPDIVDQDCETASSVLLSDPKIDINKEKQHAIANVVNENDDTMSCRKKKSVTLPWPTRDDQPLSEFTTRNFFTLAFPCLFPHGTADFFSNRPRTCDSLSEWANHILWFDDGRFARHQIFKFIVHNMISRKRTIEQSNFIVQQKLGEEQLSVSTLKEQIQNGDESFSKKLLYLGSNLRGTSQYWTQRLKELRSLIQFKINEGKGLPAFFATGSCAEFYFKPLKRLLQIYIKESTGKDIDLDNKPTLFKALQENTHIVADYFDKRTLNYFHEFIMPVFNVDTYWYRQEFAKSRGMIHWHGLCWRGDSEPHQLMFDAIKNDCSDEHIANELSQWAEKNFKMTASHPAGVDENGQPRKDFWPPPEGSAEPPSEEQNPLFKLFMDISKNQQTILEDHLLLTNKINIHRCSDYCLRKPKQHKRVNEKVCRMEFGTPSNPGKTLRTSPAIVKDKNGSLRLEMVRDHPMLVQHSQLHTQAWRANGDVSVILSKSDPQNPSVNDIIATETYITNYACKGGESTGAVVDLFNDLINSTDEETSAKSVCTKLLMQTTKRDISAVEASYELSSLPLYRCNYTFQNVSFTGARLLEKSGSTLTKQSSLDKYLARPDDSKESWYNFISKSGHVPVISGGELHCTWPLTENFSRTMLLLHWPNWRQIRDIKPDDSSWVNVMSEFLLNPECPNFVKAGVERAFRKMSSEGNDDTSGSESEGDMYSDEEMEPEWLELIRPNVDFRDDCGELDYNDGGEEHDWSTCSHDYPGDLGVKFIDKTASSVENNPKTLDLPDADVLTLNYEQQFAFNIVMKTLLDYSSDSTQYTPLRLIVAGTAGSGKSYLIKCRTNLILRYTSYANLSCIIFS